MLREVIYHANLEHDNIVQYKTTWQGSILPDEEKIIERLKGEKFSGGNSESSLDQDSESSSDSAEQEQYSKECLYIALELCDGGTLEDMLDRNLMNNPKKPLQILKKMCSAVAYIHNNGLIHRDLKPGNIFFQKDSIKIADFGLVTNTGLPQKTDSSSQPTENLTGMVGTSMYMAPEVQAEKNYDNKADIYSLGLVFMKLLVPFDRKESEFLWKVKVHGDKAPFKNSSFLQFLAECLKEEIKSKSKWITEAEKIMEKLKKIPW